MNLSKVSFKEVNRILLEEGKQAVAIRLSLGKEAERQLRHFLRENDVTA